jgi:dual specificity MAP kinase phosphatase
MHGLHPDNHIQLAFFVGRKKGLRKLPKLLRCITIIKAGGDLSRARIKGAIAPDEVLSLCDDAAKGFVECDPREGFSVRNFHIQAAKIAQVSDIIVYGDDNTDARIIKSVAERTASVQRKWRRDLEATGQYAETFNTFVLTESFDIVEEKHPELVVVDSSGRSTSHGMDFLQWERAEMCAMSKASKISQGVFQGPSPARDAPRSEESNFDVFIETSDHGSVLDLATLKIKAAQIGGDPVHILFPSSGSILPPSWSQMEVNGLLNMCRWIYNVTHRSHLHEQMADEDGDIQMAELSPKQRRVLIHCADGYTESSMLIIAYFMFAEGIPVHEAWTRLHCEKGRNFFAYPSDVALLTSIQDRILSESPVFEQAKRDSIKAPAWLSKLDGSLPSRILPYMYLGNLTHANNPELLKELGIRRILSIGEPVSWSHGEKEKWGRQNLLMVDRVQDNGIDPLTGEFERCLEFIGESSAGIH